MDDAKKKYYAFAKSDEELPLVRKILRVIMTLAAAASVIGGIVIAVQAIKLLRYGYGGWTTMGLALWYLAGVPALCWVSYKLASFGLWVAFDIKMIRNKLYGVADSASLTSMVGYYNPSSASSAIPAGGSYGGDNDAWKCDCGKTNSGGITCTDCGKPRLWKCHGCGTSNPWTNSECRNCGSLKV